MASADSAAVRPNLVQGGRLSRYTLRTIALGYLSLLLLVPVAVIFYKAFGDGFQTHGTPSRRRRRSTPST